MGIYKMKRIYFDNSNGLDSLAESIILQAVKDYTRSYRKILRNPADKKAAAVMKECEDFLVADARVSEMISDPLELLYRLDQQIEKEHQRRMQCQK